MPPRAPARLTDAAVTPRSPTHLAHAAVRDKGGLFDRKLRCASAHAGAH
jgi:hypothetical protein